MSHPPIWMRHPFPTCGKTLAFWKGQGKTIVVSEHRLYYLRGLADRFIYMKGGKITREYTSEEFKGLSEQARTEIGLRTFALEQLQPPQTPQCTGTELELKQFRFAYPHGSSILHIQDCTIPAGRIVGIIGNNGLASPLFTVLLWAGEAMRRGNLERQAIPFERSAEHLLYGHAGGKPSALYRNSPGRSVDQHGGAGYEKQAEEILTRLDLSCSETGTLCRFPAGRNRGLAIASAIASKRSILFFDEPTSGLDYRHMKEVAAVLRQLSTEGVTVYVITHDLELLLDCCTDIIHFAQGKTLLANTLWMRAAFQGSVLILWEAAPKVWPASVRAGTPAGTCRIAFLKTDANLLWLMYPTRSATSDTESRLPVNNSADFLILTSRRYADMFCPKTPRK